VVAIRPEKKSVQTLEGTHGLLVYPYRSSWVPPAVSSSAALLSLSLMPVTPISLPTSRLKRRVPILHHTALEGSLGHFWQLEDISRRVQMIEKILRQGFIVSRPSSAALCLVEIQTIV
jgi:hypothetical protein